VLGRPDDDAPSAVALWRQIEGRLGLDDVVVRASQAPAGLHPTRTAALVDRTSGATLGYVSEVDSELVAAITTVPGTRRLALLDLDFDALANPEAATRRSASVRVPSRFPSAVIDLAFVTPRPLHAADLEFALRGASDLVESVELFDVYEGPGLTEGSRSLAYNVRFSSSDRTLSDQEISEARAALIAVASSLGAQLR
jgi:phenylalanyl-tRNA synthetase beta chain